MNTREIHRKTAIYNMVPNLFWTILFLSPVYVFCSRYMGLGPSFILLGPCMMLLFLPNTFFNAIQLSKKPRFYEAVGVKFINQFAQNGRLINRYLRKKYPELKAMAANRSYLMKTYRQTWFFEKFHFSLFVFTSAITVYSVCRSLFTWMTILSVCNLFFNIYPNLLQQYIRVKLTPLLGRGNQV